MVATIFYLSTCEQQNKMINILNSATVVTIMSVLTCILYRHRNTMKNVNICNNMCITITTELLPLKVFLSFCKNNCFWVGISPKYMDSTNTPWSWNQFFLWFDRTEWMLGNWSHDSQVNHNLTLNRWKRRSSTWEIFSFSPGQRSRKHTTLTNAKIQSQENMIESGERHWIRIKHYW